jgi:hypothetical protein
MPKLNRRDFVRAAGVLGASALLPLLRGSRSIAQSGEIPKRFVLVNGGDGGFTREWEPRPLPGQETYGPTSFDMGPIFEPLMEYRSDIVFFENLDMVSVSPDPIAPGSAHYNGSTHFLSGVNRLSDTLVGGISIDQYIARELTRGGVTTALPSLEIAIQAGGDYADATWSSSGPGERIPALGNPLAIYDRLFPASTAAPDTSAELDRTRAIFAFSRGEYGRLADRISPEDRIKLQQHLDLMNSLESRQLLRLSGGDRRHLWPDRSIVAGAEDLSWEYNDPREVWAERYNVAAEMNMRLAAAALHADVTRVVAIHMEDPPGSSWGYTPGAFGTDDPHGLSHEVNGEEGTLANDPDARALKLEEKRQLFGKVRMLIDELARLEEVDGSRLLDHTVLVFTSHIGDGSHTTMNLPWFTVGSAGGYLRTGRLVQFPRVERAGRAHNDLFVTLANAHGVETDTFGNPDVCTGPIEEMLA